MDINAANLELVNKSVRALTMDSLEKAVREYAAVAMEVPSMSAAEHYRWLKSLPGIREWVGDRIIHNVASEGFSIANKRYEQTVGLPLEDIERDNLGVYRPLFSEMGRQAGIWPDELIGAVLANAITLLCYDGQPLVDTDHPVNGGVISNKLTLALNQANYETSRATMASFTNDQGKKLKIRGTVLYHAANLSATARSILQDERLANGQSNISRGTAVPLQVDELPDSRWGLMDLSRDIKPVILQTEKAFQWVARDNPEIHEAAFRSGEAQYGIDGRYGAGPGFWRLILQSAPSWP